MRTSGWLVTALVAAALTASALGACTAPGASADPAACDTLCTGVPDCGGTSCLAECITTQAACTDTAHDSAFDDWASCQPILVCQNNQLVSINCALQQIGIDTGCHTTTTIDITGGDAGTTGPFDASHPEDGQTGTGDTGHSSQGQDSGGSDAGGFDAPMVETGPSCGTETACDSVCVDIQTDIDNCGGCGVSCSSKMENPGSGLTATLACVGGQCQETFAGAITASCTSNPGACEASCASVCGDQGLTCVQSGTVSGTECTSAGPCAGYQYDGYTCGNLLECNTSVTAYSACEPEISYGDPTPGTIYEMQCPCTGTVTLP